MREQDWAPGVVMNGEAVGCGKQRKPEKWGRQGVFAGTGSPGSISASSSGAGGLGEEAPSSSLSPSLLRGSHP